MLLYELAQVADLEDCKPRHLRHRRVLGPRSHAASLTAETAAGGGLDLILVPGIGFDQNKRRLGHGR